VKSSPTSLNEAALELGRVDAGVTEGDGLDAGALRVEPFLVGAGEDTELEVALGGLGSLLCLRVLFGGRVVMYTSRNRYFGLGRGAKGDSGIDGRAADDDDDGGTSGGEGMTEA